MSDDTAPAVLQTDQQIIAALGGPHAISEKLGFSSHHTVTMWRKRDRIAAQYNPTLKTIAEEAGFSVRPDYLDPPKR